MPDIVRETRAHAQPAWLSASFGAGRSWLRHWPHRRAARRPCGGYVAGRQGRLGSVLLCAARRRHARRHLQEVRARHPVERVPRRRQAAAGDGGRRHRHCARLRALMAFIAKGSPVKAIAATTGPPLVLTITVRPDGPTNRRRAQGQEDQRLHQGLADRLAGAGNIAAAGLGSERHQRGSARPHQGAAHRHGQRRHRRHGGRRRHRARSCRSSTRAASWYASAISRTSSPT